MSSCPVLWVYRGLSKKVLGFPRDKTTDNWETKKINYESFVTVLVWHSRCIIFDMKIWETQNVIHIWNYTVTFKICLMKLNLIRTGKLLAWNFMHERKWKTAVPSAKCSIYWVKLKWHRRGFAEFILSTLPNTRSGD